MDATMGANKLHWPRVQTPNLQGRAMAIAHPMGELGYAVAFTVYAEVGTGIEGNAEVLRAAAQKIHGPRHGRWYV